MKRVIVEFVAKCLTCQKIKAKLQVPTGLLHSISIPQWKWERITMDFTKLTHFITVRMDWSLQKLAEIYIQEIEHYLPLAEFVYNNSFQLSIQMAPYEALYGRRCRKHVCWSDLCEKKVIGVKLIQ
ncbi:Retrotransposon protein, Ty3-gypsy subclass [Gossypium australe]|uniref:Retrotransposon protein, Ty3-gypsy subclass n=1 Tax=Gossypium australe TaxID=47621 RepID=A0A5B6WEP9_9ROSI|nr:Retrotransposon protein, Ty3-gypsy subclass [Gossypium australe]